VEEVVEVWGGKERKHGGGKAV